MERIYKQDWEYTFVDEKILGIEMRDGNKYYLLPNVDGFVPVNLKEHVSCGYSGANNLEDGIPENDVLDGDKKVFEFNSMQEVVAWATS